jgi:4-phytase/acid phosphatase
MVIRSLLLALVISVLAANAEAAPENGSASALKLDRVVILMRHGVRPPTKSAAALAPFADRPWPDDRAWGAAPGELTPHGAEAIRRLAAGIARFYAGQGLAASPTELASTLALWADGADERTRATAAAFAEGINPKAPPAYGADAAGQSDPLFDPAAVAGCPADPAAALAAVSASGPVVTASALAGLARLQAILAPQGCAGGPGACFSGPSTLSADPSGGVKLSGPLGTGASLAENILLEYENALPADQVGWGRATVADLPALMAVHNRASDLTRATPYLAVRRGGPLARLIAGLLTDADPAPAPTDGKRLVVLVGHDTNLSNLAGAFGLSWSLPDQPDPTAPGTALAFERWRNPVTGAEEVRVRVFYQTPDQTRGLSGALNPPVDVRPALCGPSERACSPKRLADAVDHAIPAGCRLEAGAVMPIAPYGRSEP